MKNRNPETGNGKRANGRPTASLEGPRLIGWATLALGVMTALLLGIYGTGEPGIRVMIRATARTSVVLFTAAFTASSAARLWPRPLTKWMLRNRRYLGLSFAVSHAVHLLFIVYAAAVVGFLQVNSVALIGGGLAYVFIAAMAATSFDAAVTWLGRRRWQRLHTVGAYYIWFIFLQTYLPRAFTDAAYVPVTLLVAGGIVVRIAAWRRGARHTPGEAGMPQPARHSGLGSVTVAKVGGADDLAQAEPYARPRTEGITSSAKP